MFANKAVRLYGKEDLRVEYVPVPEPGENYVQVRMSSGGICGSDIHIYDDGQIDRFIIDKPLTLGHEISGTISKLGPGITHLSVGDRVAIDPIISCSRCRSCERGSANVCQKLNVSGLLELDGGLANFMVTPASACYKLPDSVSLEEGAMIEPLSVAVHAIQRAQMRPGDRVIVLGAGPIGLFVMQTVKALGAEKVLVVDINKRRLEMAAEMGADMIFKPTVSNSDPVAAAEELKTILGGDADLVCECSGAKGTINTSIHACRPGGKTLVIGVGAMSMEAHLGVASIREIDLVGTFANANTFPECIELVASGKVNLKPAITHRLRLDQVKEGFDIIKRGEAIKILIDCTS